MQSVYDFSAEQESYPPYFGDYGRNSTDNAAWTFGPAKAGSGVLPPSPDSGEYQNETFETSSMNQASFYPSPESSMYNGSTHPIVYPQKCYFGGRCVPFPHQFEEYRTGLPRSEPECLQYSPSPSDHEKYTTPSSLPIGACSTAESSGVTMPSASTFIQEQAHYYPADYHVMAHTHSQLYMCQETYISCPPQSCSPLTGPLPVESPSSVSFDAPKFKLTQERAQPLIRWYEDHKDHPYPNRQEKLQLCQLTQLTYTQVSTWFANARRRNKKMDTVNSSSEDSDNN